MGVAESLTRLRDHLPAAGRRVLDAGAREVSRVLPERARVRLAPAHARFGPDDVPPPPKVPAMPVRLYVGPANYAGQGHAWARAAERLPGVGAVSMAAVRQGSFAFAVDDAVPEPVYSLSRGWQRERRALLPRFTHVMVEAGRPLLGQLVRGGALAEARWLAERGVAVAIVCHGSEIRLPSRHRELEPWSPFTPDWELTAVLEERAARLARSLERLGLPVLVSTPDLLLDVPAATWLPVVVDVERWAGAGQRGVLEREVPVVVHAPSSSHVKGSELAEPVLESLAVRGLIEYRRVEGVPAADMPRVYGEADVVLDQLRIGNYGVAACEAMAAGRVVVSHVSEVVREHAREAAGADLPILEATADSLEQVLLDVLADRDRARALAAQGPAFVRTLHDGTRSAEVLSPFLH